VIPSSLSVTMKDVAAELGVSVTTISKVSTTTPTSARPPVSACSPRSRARLPPQRRGDGASRYVAPTRLGVIVSDLMHSFFVEVVTAIEESLGRQGYGLLLCNLGEDRRRNDGNSRCCSNGRSMASSSPRPTRRRTATCCGNFRARARAWS
jgi:hypothetical protein